MYSKFVQHTGWSKVKRGPFYLEGVMWQQKHVREVVVSDKAEK